MKADAKTESEVMSVLKKFTEAFEKRNLEDMLMLFAPDPDVVAIGSEADEKLVGMNEIKAFFKRYFDHFEALSMEFGWTMVSTAGKVAWAVIDDTVTVKAGGQETILLGRLTSVLEKRGDKWLIVQMHHSVPQD